jgi:Fe-S-cluster containining protein
MEPKRVDGQAIVRAERESVQIIVAAGRHAGAIDAVVHDAHTHADWLTDAAKRLIPPGPIACRAGCSFCCHLRVLTTIPEVLRIAGYLQQELQDGALRAIKDRTARHRAATAGRNAAERRRLRLACPLLVDGMCLAYEVRPLSCRGWNSIDVSVCESDFHDPSQVIKVPVYGPQYEVSSFIQLGLDQGLDAVGLQHDRVELPEALEIALETDDVANRWLRGERIFTPAVD